LPCDNSAIVSEIASIFGIPGELDPKRCRFQQNGANSTGGTVAQPRQFVKIAAFELEADLGGFDPDFNPASNTFEVELNDVTASIAHQRFELLEALRPGCIEATLSGPVRSYNNGILFISRATGLKLVGDNCGALPPSS
jgi:hypothetical protein